MPLLEFLKPSNPTVPPPGTSAHKAYLRATGNTPEQGREAYEAQQSVPPPGTSAYNAYQYFQEHGKIPPNPFFEDPEPNNPSPKPYRPTAGGLTPANIQDVDFINADLAKYYGMSKATAYQEALLNTAYQREVQDMKAAGLNPAVMYSGGRASGADTSLYPSEKRSGGGGYSRRRYGSKASNGKLFSSSAYSAIQAIGGLVGIATTKRPDGFWIGSQTAKGAMGFLDAIIKR